MKYAQHEKQIERCKKDTYKEAETKFKGQISQI